MRIVKGLSVGDTTTLLVVDVVVDALEVEVLVINEEGGVFVVEVVDRRHVGGTGQIVLVTYTTVVTTLGVCSACEL